MRNENMLDVDGLSWLLGDTEPQSTQAPPPDNIDATDTQPQPPPTAQDPANTTPMVGTATNLATPTPAAGQRNHYNLLLR